MFNYRPSFAQNQLQKHGWEEGKGLGKEEHGIKSAIKVKLKNNKGGLGHDGSAEFTFHWWDHIFNKAANAIEVHNDEEKEEVVIKKNENAKKIVPQLMYNKKPLSVSTNGKPLLYGTFVSGGTVKPDIGDDSASSQTTSESDSSDSEEEEYSTDLLDRTYKKTGLTGHKGARHGQTMSGKLKRILDQENNAVNSDTDNKLKQKHSETQNLSEEKAKTKKGKRKPSESVDNELDEIPKKKKKKKKAIEAVNTVQEEEIPKKKKKKSKTVDIVPEEEENPKNKKKRNKETVDDNEEKTSKKKKKNKNKDE